MTLLGKFDFIKNKQIAVELVKRVYSAVRDFTVFIQFMRYLFGADEQYKEVLEEKALPIVSQMVKMDQKVPLK